MVSSKLTKRRATPVKPHICHPPPPPPPPPWPWPPTVIFLSSDLRIDNPGAPYDWFPSGPATNVAGGEDYAFEIIEGARYWGGSLSLDHDTRWIAGYAYGVDEFYNYFDCTWAGPFLPDPWNRTITLTTIDRNGLLAEISYVGQPP